MKAQPKNLPPLLRNRKTGTLYVPLSQHTVNVTNSMGEEQQHLGWMAIPRTIEGWWDHALVVFVRQCDVETE